MAYRQPGAARILVAVAISFGAGYALAQYACHEGNLSLRGMLSALRAEEAAAAAPSR